MADNKEEEFSGFSDTDLSFSQESGLYLPFPRCQQPAESHKLTAEQRETIPDNSQNEPSNTSENSTCEFTDPFDCIFYHIMPKEGATEIFFYVRPLFSSIVSALQKEFVFPDNNDKKISLKTHIDGKRCNIAVNKSEMILRLSGPGQEIWKEKNFKRMTVNMFNNFVDETKTVLNASTCNGEDFKGNRLYDQGGLSAQPGLFVQVDTESPLMYNISGMIDMIRDLQRKVTTLVAQVNKLLVQEANSRYETVDETLNLSRAEDITNTNNNMSGIASMEQPSTKSGNRDGPARQESSSLTTPSTTRTMVTSTPRTSRTQPNSQAPQQPRPQSRPHPRLQLRAMPEVRPVPKPRLPKQVNDQKQVLLIGDSIISGVNPRGLKESVHRNGMSGATVESIIKEVKLFDLEKFSHVVIYVGGNNASRGSDIEFFEEKYDQLLDYIMQKNHQCKVLLASSCPRGDADTSDINGVIHRLAQVHKMQFVDMDHAFHNKHGEIIDRYYSRDSIHLSQSGIKRLLGTLNNFVEIVSNFNHCVYGRQNRKPTPHFQRLQHSNRRTSQNELNYRCNKCGERNHNTRQCHHPEPIQCHGCGFYGHKTKRCGAV